MKETLKKIYIYVGMEEEAKSWSTMQMLFGENYSSLLLYFLLFMYWLLIYLT